MRVTSLDSTSTLKSCLQCPDTLDWVTARAHNHRNLLQLSPKASHYAFSALTLLVGRQERHQACKSGGCWRSCLFGARCRLAYGPADATATH